MSKLPVWVQSLLVTLVGLLVGGGLLWYSESNLSSPEHATASVVVTSIGGIIITSGFFQWWGTYQAHQQALNYFKSSHQLADVARSAGVSAVSKWPITLPTRANVVDMLLIRGHHWIGERAPAFRQLFGSAGCETRICLAHPRGSMIEGMAYKFREDEETTSQKIIESILAVVGVAEQRGSRSSRVRLYLHSVIPVYSYYRFDERSHLVFYSMCRGKQDVPLLELTDGELYNCFVGEFDQLLREPDSILVYDSSLSASENHELLVQVCGDSQQLKWALGLSDTNQE